MYVDFGLTKKIIGCKYRSPFNLNQHLYMLINGTIKSTDGFRRPTFGESRKRRIAINEYLPTFNFPEFYVTSYDELGEVRCAIFDPNRMNAPVLSTATTYNDTAGTMES